MKLAVIIYHKNIRAIYPQRWIDTCIKSILSQEGVKFDVLELNYGGENLFYYPNSKQYTEVFSNHAEAMNYLLDKAFKEENYDAVANINMDDFYPSHRFKRQLEEIKKGAELVSAQWHYVDEMDNRIGGIYYTQSDLDKLDNENVIGHPVVMYAKSFWDNMRYVPSEVPKEDWYIWQRAKAAGKNIVLLEELLMYHRIHSNKISWANSNKKADKRFKRRL